MSSIVAQILSGWKNNIKIWLRLSYRILVVQISSGRSYIS